MAALHLNMFAIDTVTRIAGVQKGAKCSKHGIGTTIAVILF
jgi:hypothetical protein